MKTFRARVDELRNQVEKAAIRQRTIFSTKNCTRAICEYYKVTESDVLGLSRARHVIRARQHLHWLLYTSRIDLSVLRIGALTNRDHSTITHSVQTVYGEWPRNKPQIDAVNQRVRELHESLSKTTSAREASQGAWSASFGLASLAPDECSTSESGGCSPESGSSLKHNA